MVKEYMSERDAGEGRGTEQARKLLLVREKRRFFSPSHHLGKSFQREEGVRNYRQIDTQELGRLHNIHFRRLYTYSLTNLPLHHLHTLNSVTYNFYIKPLTHPHQRLFSTHQV